ncbi:beta-lactamase family protein [Simiduia sp. 21SJ11W-1]|uniref:serine hydrolase domain-containing protein n=1 Tax=Simiduia sp. 21SJ11W-1 TaxID=2909669 RepID=UPI00209E2DE6|nr:serine hydrolase domain-containing protein [Simiduia sp. 21SJ11W-1]UTA49079.1 beta-lactamase family protein [Simiduia sp. 21SJ11W-1]
MAAFPLEGEIAPGLEPVAEVFAGLQSTQSQGAALAVYRDGECLLDVWAGARDKAQSSPWERDTRVNIFSAGKPLVALVVLQLVAEGLLDLDKPIADIWPAFGANGKADITLAQVLCHRSGVNAFHEPVKDALIFDNPAITERIASERPWWEPGSAQGYSPIIYGWILAEVIKRVTGAAQFAEVFDARVNGPLDTAIAFGVPAAEQPDLAEVSAIRGAKAEQGVLQLGRAMKDDPQGVVNKAFTNPMSLMVGTNGEAWRSAEIPAANGHASARDIACVYDALINTETLLPAALRAECWREQSAGVDRVLQTPMRFSRGFMLTQEGADRRLGRGQRAFGHAGAGGCLGFADPDYQLSFGFVSNHMAQSLLIDSRAQKLIDALYQVI